MSKKKSVIECACKLNKQTRYEFKIYLGNFSSAVTPEPDSTEDSTGGLDPTDLAIVPAVTTSTRTSPNSRRMSQPITGTPKEPDSNEPNNTRRASEGKSVEKGQSDLIRCFSFFS